MLRITCSSFDQIRFRITKKIKNGTNFEIMSVIWIIRAFASKLSLERVLTRSPRITRVQPITTAMSTICIGLSLVKGSIRLFGIIPSSISRPP